MHFVNARLSYMAQNKLINVEVAYALPTDQRILVTQIQVGATVEEAIRNSGILKIFPDIDLTKQKVGIFSKLAKLSDQVKEGDRIEIYRPLTIDPKEARRAKAKKQR